MEKFHDMKSAYLNKHVKRYEMKAESMGSNNGKKCKHCTTKIVFLSNFLGKIYIHS